jgi:hypothetical protein
LDERDLSQDMVMQACWRGEVLKAQFREHGAQEEGEIA